MGNTSRSPADKQELYFGERVIRMRLDKWQAPDDKESCETEVEVGKITKAF